MLRYGTFFAITFICASAFAAMPLKEVRIGQTIFKAEVAATFPQQRKGLMFRDTLGEREAMLFVYDHDGYFSFWMKNVKFPLDIIWLDAQKKAVYQENSRQQPIVAR